MPGRSDLKAIFDAVKDEGYRSTFDTYERFINKREGAIRIKVTGKDAREAFLRHVHGEEAAEVKDAHFSVLKSDPAFHRALAAAVRRAVPRLDRHRAEDFEYYALCFEQNARFLEEWKWRPVGR